MKWCPESLDNRSLASVRLIFKLHWIKTNATQYLQVPWSAVFTELRRRRWRRSRRTCSCDSTILQLSGWAELVKVLIWSCSFRPEDGCQTSISCLSTCCGVRVLYQNLNFVRDLCFNKVLTLCWPNCGTLGGLRKDKRGLGYYRKYG